MGGSVACFLHFLQCSAGFKPIVFKRASRTTSCEQCHDRVAKCYGYFPSLAAGPVSGSVKLGGLSNLHHTVRSDEVQPGSQLMLGIFRSLDWPRERRRRGGALVGRWGSAEATLYWASFQTIRHQYRATVLIIILNIRAAEALLCLGSLQSGRGKNTQQAMRPH